MTASAARERVPSGAGRAPRARRRSYAGAGEARRAAPGAALWTAAGGLGVGEAGDDPISDRFVSDDLFSDYLISDDLVRVVRL